MGRGGGRGGKEVIVGFLEAAVDVAAEVRKLEGAVGEIRKRWRGGGIGKVRLKEGGTSRTEQSVLTTGVGLPGKKDGLGVGKRKVSNPAGGVSNAMGSKEDGVSVWNNKGATSGGQSQGATFVTRISS
jgi:hypothetical protein